MARKETVRKRGPRARVSGTQSPVSDAGERRSSANGISGDGCAVVGVGASTGGLGVYKRLLQHMPSDAGIAMVLIQRPDPTRESKVVGLLARHTAMPIAVIEDGMPLQPNHVYVNPPDRFIRLDGDTLHLDMPAAKRGYTLPIDYFLGSLACARQARAVGIVMSGTDTDGTIGLNEVKAAGGMTIVEAPGVAEHEGMPGSAIASRAADRIVPIDDMADVIMSYLRSPCNATQPNTDTGGVQAAAKPPAEREQALELLNTQEDLQATVEKLELANKALNASNREVMSMNEELQSTNEDLETSLGRLQSLNEELSSVNSQLHDRVGELEAMTSDLGNLLASSDTATLFLDTKLRVRRFTPAISQVFSLCDSDIGRAISDLTPRVDDRDLATDAAEVLRELKPIQKEVPSDQQRTFLRTLTPFKTVENRIEGIVATFADVTRLKHAIDRLALRERQQATVAQLGRAALSGLELQALCDQAVVDVATTLGVDLVKVLRLDAERNELLLLAGVGWNDGLVGHATVPAGIDSQAGYTLQTAAPVISTDVRTEARFHGSALHTQHGVVSGLSVIIGPEDRPWGVLGVHARHAVEFDVDDTHFVLAVANLLWEGIRRHAAEAELRANEQRTASFLRNSAVFGWMKDAHGRFVYLSETYRQRFDFIPDDWMGKTDTELWTEDIGKSFRKNDLMVLEKGEVIEAIETAQRDDGSEMHFLVSKFPFTDAAGKRFVGGLGVDISERIAADQALAASQKRLEKLVDSASVGIAFVEQDGRITQANDAMLRLFGVSREAYEHQGWNWRDNRLSERKYFNETMTRLAGDGLQPFEFMYRAGDSESVWVLASARHLDPAGSEHVVFMVDVTAQKLAELALAESEERLSLAARMAGFGTYFADVRRGVIDWSEEFKALLGLRPQDKLEDAIGQVPSFVHPDDRERVAEQLAASLDPAGKGEMRTEHRVRCVDGSIRWILMQGRTLFEGDGPGRHAAKLAGIVLDMSERHRFEDQLREARRAAEAANAAKSRFLANMSHELRTPLTAIVGFTDVLDDRLDDPDDKACIRTIRDNSDHLRQILNDVLDLAKIEAGKVTLHREPCDPIAIASSIRSLFAARAAQKRLRLSLEFSSAMPRTVHTDPKMLRQVLLNLVGNAINFTETGAVRILMSCDADDQRLTVSVIDSGIGIAQDDLDSLFLPFEQLDSSAARQVGGTGLGLSITRKLVKALGGSITVQSKPGHGSTFTFCLCTGPLDAGEWVTPEEALIAQQKTETAIEPLPAIRGRVLAIDDRREIRFLVKEFIESAGATVVTATGGAQGVAQWRNDRDAGNPVDAVLMDIQMPGMDGLEATGRLRDEGYRGPIIALTASAMQRDRDACLQAGCDEVLAKPIDRAELVRKLSAWLPYAAPDSQSAEEPPETGGRCILCVDDHADTCSLQKILLERIGHRVVTATSGAEALQRVENFTPDVALLDLELGDMSGATLLQHLKALPGLSKCLFICVSGHDPGEIAWRDLGFNRFLQKPASVDQINELLDGSLPAGFEADSNPT